MFIDQTLTFFIIIAPHPWIFSLLFHFFSAQGIYIIIWFGIFLYRVFFEEKKRKLFVISFLTSLVITALSVALIKNITARPRPLTSHPSNFLQLGAIPADYPTDYSFPSGHAAISFASAGILSAFDKKRRVYFYLIASLIAFSRVYLGYHYVSDIVAGALLGWLISFSLMSLRVKPADSAGRRKSSDTI